MLSDVNQSGTDVLQGEGGWVLVFSPLSLGLRKQLVVVVAVQNHVAGEQEGSFCHTINVPIPGKNLVCSLPYASNRLL